MGDLKHGELASGGPSHLTRGGDRWRNAVAALLLHYVALDLDTLQGP